MLPGFPSMDGESASTAAPLTGIARLAAISSPRPARDMAGATVARGSVDLRPECLPERAKLCLAYQSLSRMLACLPLLLRSLYPRIYGTAAG